MQTELPETRTELGIISLRDVCLIADAGEFITHTLDILARFAIDAVYGHHVSDYANARILSLFKEHDLSDLDTVDYLDDKLAALKYLIPAFKETRFIASLMDFQGPSLKVSTAWLSGAGSAGTRFLRSRAYQGSKRKRC